MNHPTKITAAVPCGTAPASQAPVGVGATYSPCPNCEGTGFFTAGAFHPDDPRCEATWDCEDCQGTGEVESDTHCQCGEPLDDDLWCASCHEIWPTGWALAEQSALRRVA